MVDYFILGLHISFLWFTILYFVLITLKFNISFYCFFFFPEFFFFFFYITWYIIGMIKTLKLKVHSIIIFSHLRVPHMNMMQLDKAGSTIWYPYFLSTIWFCPDAGIHIRMRNRLNLIIFLIFFMWYCIPKDYPKKKKDIAFPQSTTISLLRPFFF